MTADLNDEQLMRNYAAGNSAAFAHLFGRHQGAVFRFLLRSLGGQRAPAEDLLQDVWLAVIRNAPTWEPRAKFTTWLFTIARSRLIDHWRAQERGDAPSNVRAVHLDDEQQMHGDDSHAAAAAGPLALAADRIWQPEVRAVSRAQARAFVAAVEQLPAAQREAFLLHAEGDLTVADIARQTDTPAETIKSRLRYALAKLRVAMEEWS